MTTCGFAPIHICLQVPAPCSCAADQLRVADDYQPEQAILARYSLPVFYPPQVTICWGCSEGGNVIVTSEMIGMASSIFVPDLYFFLPFPQPRSVRSVTRAAAASEQALVPPAPRKGAEERKGRQRERLEDLENTSARVRLARTLTPFGVSFALLANVRYIKNRRHDSLLRSVPRSRSPL